MAGPGEGAAVKATSVARRRMRERAEVATARREFKDSRPWWPAYPITIPLEQEPYYPLTFHITHQTEGWVKP